ncbi:MAG: hypothetical protein ACE149_09465 [Armatimonadota bacterium]
MASKPDRLAPFPPAALAVSIATLLLLSAFPAFALKLPEEAPASRALIYSFWSNQYLCLAAKVPDTMLTGSNTAPMSSPDQDDAVEFDLEVQAPTGTEAHRLIISAAGGMTVLTRDSRGQWRADPSWVTGPRTVKFAVGLDGTINNPNDRDTGYVVECAIPWEFLGGQAPVGRELGFNVIIWMQGENEGVASWSAGVREPSQAGDAALWGRMGIGAGSAMAKPTGARFACPLVPAPPFIDGRLAAAEWLAAGALEIPKPEPVIQLPVAPAEKTGVPAAVTAIYRYDWQGGEDAPAGAPFWSSGNPATSNQPRTGAGPWISYRRVDWHAQQIAGAYRAGIDILFARYSGHDVARHTWARLGLGRMAQALKQRRAQGLGYPLVGMMLDTASLQGADLRTPDQQRRLYGMIREFFRQVPPEFWAQIGARPEEGLRAGVPVLLGEPDVLAGWDAGFATYCEVQFARDFAGARLIWIGSSAWRAEGLNLYSVIKLPTETGFAASAPDGVPAVALSPGCAPPPGEVGPVRPRMEGRAYRTDWQRALALKPELVIINSWNDYQYATELAPSRQYGVIYEDITRLFRSRLGSQEPHRLWLKQERVPAVIAPGADCQAEFIVENIGTDALRTGARLSVDTTITRRSDGKVLRRKRAVQALNIAAGQTQRLPVTIAAKDDKGQPLPAGDYLYTLSVTRSSLAYVRSSWFARSIADLVVPFTVGPVPAHKATIVSTSLPSALDSGGSETVIVRLRNDGSAAWRAGDVRLSYHWVKMSGDLLAPSGEAAAATAPQGAPADLPRDVPPGGVVSVAIPVLAADSDGTPLPPDRPDDLSQYAIAWDMVTASGEWFSREAGPAGAETVEIAAHDPGVVFESVSTPSEMDPGASGTAEVVIANAGPRTWPSGVTRITQEWLSWDGRSPAADLPRDAGLPLPEPIEPGGKARLTVPLSPPSAPGPYWLLWRVTGGDDGAPWLSSGRWDDLYVASVFVRPASVQVADLSPYANIVGIAADAYRARGDFDGRGATIPAECLPPDQSGATGDLYPPGYYSPGTRSGSPPFVFPDTSAGLGSVVACAGQHIPLGSQPVVRVHLIAASTAGDRPAVFRLGLASGDIEEITTLVPSWDKQSEAAPVAAYSPYLRTLSGDDAGRQAYLYHVILLPQQPASFLELPRDPSLKVIAVTTETK